MSLVSAVLLAAGSGTRMGRLKQLLPLGDDKRVKLVEVNDEGVVMDMDTKEDYMAIVRKIGVVQNVEGP